MGGKWRVLCSSALLLAGNNTGFFPAIIKDGNGVVQRNIIYPWLVTLLLIYERNL